VSQFVTVQEFQIVMQILPASMARPAVSPRGRERERSEKWEVYLSAAHVGENKSSSKRHNSSGRSDFMPDFNYQYSPIDLRGVNETSCRRPTIEQWAQIISYAKRVVFSNLPPIPVPLLSD